MWSLKPKAYLNLWGDALICLLLNPEWQLLPHIRHASLMLPNCSEIPQNHPKKARIENSLYRCNVFHKAIHRCCRLLNERAKSHVSVLFVFLVETHAYLFIYWEKGHGEGPSAHFSAWQAIWLPICLLLYLLPAESQQTFCTERRAPRQPARPTLLLTHRASTATSHTLLCTFQRSITTNMFSLGKPSQNPGLKTAPKATWMTRVENKQNRSTCC